MPALLQWMLAVVVVSATAADLAVRRIPNWITAPAAAVGIAFQAWYGGWRGAALALAGVALGFAVFLVLYLAGGMGAGDVKLFAAVGAFLGPQALLIVFVFTGLLGGVAALGLTVARGRLRQTLVNTGHILLNMGLLRWHHVRESSELHAPGALRLPYGAVIAGGTLLYLALLHQW